MLNNVIATHMENALSEIHTAFPAKVLCYDAQKQCVDLKPVLQKKLKNNSVLSQPVLHHVPLIFPASGGAYLHFPVSQGDTVLVICCERSLDQWLSSQGDEVDPQDTRKFNLSDCIALPGFYTFKTNIKSKENTLTLKYLKGEISIDDKSLTIQTDDNLIIHSAKTIQIKSDSKIEIDCAVVKFKGDIQCNGIECTELKAQNDLSVQGISFLKHTHDVVKEGMPTSTPKLSGL